MRKLRSILVLILVSFLFVSCGAEKDVLNGQTERSDGYKDIQVESDTLFENDGGFTVLGVQYYQGASIQLRAISKDETIDVYLYREDGSSELLLQEISKDYSFAEWFLDTEGCFYCWSYSGNLVKLNASGEQIFRKPLSDMNLLQFKGICQLPDGRVIVSYPETNMVREWTIGEVNQSTGEITKINEVKLIGMGYIGAGEEGLLYMDAYGVWEIDVDTGSKTEVMLFGETSYLLKEEPAIKDLRLLEDGSVELLRSEGKYDGKVTSEVLQVAEIATEKTLLVLRGIVSGNSPVGKWLKDQIFLFNQENESYHVTIETCEYGEDKEEFARQTSIQIATGKGPDILFGDVLSDYIYGMIQKEALVDVSPYMESSGMKEDYFPAAFDCWRDGEKIYGVNLRIVPEGYRVSEAVLGTREIPDVEALVDALIAWQEPAVFLGYSNFDSKALLNYFLQGSENLWEMIDWETSACEFDNELFAKMLEVSKKYGYDERNNYPSIAEDRVLENLLRFDTKEDQEAEGMVLAGVLFDDGVHAVVDSISSMIAINANSTNIEGAWEFISFLLAEEQQVKLTGSCLPVNRNAFVTRHEEDIASWVKNDLKGITDLTEEKIAEYIETIEEARSLPIKTEPILDIICEEAADYFEGIKSVEEVIAVIENRVSLYLEENK